MTERFLDRAQRALQERHALPEEWRAVTGVNQMRLYLTPEELKALDDEIVKLLLGRHADRRAPSPDHPEGAERVEILTFALPAAMKGCGSTATPACSWPASRSACSATPRCGSRSGCGRRSSPARAPRRAW